MKLIKKLIVVVSIIILTIYRSIIQCIRTIIFIIKVGIEYKLNYSKYLDDKIKKLKFDEEKAEKKYIKNFTDLFLQSSNKLQTSIQFIKDYGAYKTRDKYKLSEDEYLKKIEQITMTLINQRLFVDIVEKIYFNKKVPSEIFEWETKIVNEINRRVANNKK